jgi:hypothetical protein
MVKEAISPMRKQSHLINRAVGMRQRIESIRRAVMQDRGG